MDYKWNIYVPEMNLWIQNDKQIIQNLLIEKLKFTSSIVDSILSYKFKFELRWEYYSIWDILFKNDKISKKFVSKKNLLNTLKELWFPMRLWEELLISGIITIEQYEMALKNYFNNKKSNDRLLFWDELLYNDLFEAIELITYLEKNKYRLRVWEILLKKWLIDDNELKNLLKLQNERWKNEQLINLLNDSKKNKFASFIWKWKDYIDKDMVEEILLIQRLSAKKIVDRENIESWFDNWIKVDETSLDQEMAKRYFWDKTSYVVNPKSTDDEVDPFSNERVHPIIRAEKIYS